MSKTTSGMLAGFVVAFLLFGNSSTHNLASALTMAFSVIVVMAISGLALLMVTEITSPGATRMAMRLWMYKIAGLLKPSIKNVQQKSRSQAEPRTQSKCSAVPHINYEQYEVPTYLRRGYNREEI